MGPPIPPNPAVTTDVLDVTPTAAHIIIPSAAGLTTGNDLTAPGVPPANSLSVFPVQTFIPPFDITTPLVHFDPSNPFPISSSGLFDDASAPNLLGGPFDPYYTTYPPILPSSPANNHTLSVGPSNAARGSAAGTNRFKRPRPQENSGGNGQPKRRKAEQTAERGVRIQAPVHQGFQVGHSQAARPVNTSVQYEVAAEPNHRQSNEVASSSMSLPIMNEEYITDTAPPTSFKPLPRPLGITNDEYVKLLSAQMERQFPSTLT